MDAFDRCGRSRRVWGPKPLCFSRVPTREDSKGLEGRGGRCDLEPAPGRPARCKEEELAAGSSPGVCTTSSQGSQGPAQ